jgi:DNA-directed RNA polymerase specialized sigma24 family protein
VEVDGPEPDEEALACLADLTASSGELFQQLTRLSHCLDSTRGQHLPGPSHAQMMPLEDRLATVEQISAAIRAVIRGASQFRRLEARALYAEGLTMAELATVFGVSRQRVSALLRHTEDSARAGPPYGAPATRANI